MPESLPEQIGLLGRHLVRMLKPWECRGRAVALDSTSARLTPANTADNSVAPYLIEELPEEARFVLGDVHTTTLPTSGTHTCEAPSSSSGSWSPPNEGLTRTPTMAWRSGASSTSCAA